MPGWSQRPLFKNPTNMTGGGPVGMPKGMSIPGYQDGNVVQGGNMVEEMPAYRQEQLAKESQYLKAIEETARLFSTSSPKASDYMSNIHYFAGNLSGGHQIPKEQVMQDLMKAIETQRGAPKMKAGGIVGLENGGMMPELFEGEEIVETNPTINEMAGQGGTGIASVSAEPASGAMPERNVPNERGIIELAMDAEEVEDDEPMVAMAKQEAQSLLDQEFNILKSTAKAEAASGNSPSMVIKSGMDDLARSARRIENEVTEKYPEVPANTNLISSDDLIPYREQLVAVFEMPEIGGEEPLMDTSILTAKNGGKIPGYQEGSVVPEDVSWIDEDILKEAKNLNEAEELMVKRYGSDITAMRKLYTVEKDPETIGKREQEERNLPIDELLERRRLQGKDTRIADLITAMEGSGFMGATKPKTTSIPSEPGARGQTMTAPMSPSYIRDNLELIKQYQASQEDFSPPIKEVEVTAQKRDLLEGQGSGDQGLSYQGSGEDMAAILNAAKQAGYSEETALALIKLMQQGDPLADVKRQAETLKGTIKTDLEGITSTLEDTVDEKGNVVKGSISQYEKDAKKQDKDMRNIFEDIERRIPEQAKYQALTSPASGGMGSQYWGRKFKGKELEQNLFQENNRNKIEFENLRKKETEARRKQDLDALYEIKLKQAEILSGIDESILGDERAIAKSKIENELAMDLERLKIELGTTGQTYGFEATMSQREKSDNFDIEENMTYATRQYGAAQAAERYDELKGEKTVSSGGVSKKVTFPEFYRQARNAGKEPKEIIKDWVSRS